MKHAVNERNEEGKGRGKEGLDQPLRRRSVRASRTSTPLTRASERGPSSASVRLRPSVRPSLVFATLDLHARASSASVAVALARRCLFEWMRREEGLVRLTDGRTGGRARSIIQEEEKRRVMRFSSSTWLRTRTYIDACMPFVMAWPTAPPVRCRYAARQSHPAVTKKVRTNLFSGFRSPSLALFLPRWQAGWLPGNNLACRTTTS